MSQAYAEIAFDFVETVGALPDAASVLGALKSVADKIGFSSFILTGLPLRNRPLEPLVILNGWPCGWYARYIERDYFRCDPVAQQFLSTSFPFRWQDVPPSLAASSEARDFMGEAREFGLVDGYCVPLCSITGWQAACSFASDRALDLSSKELAAAHLIAITAYGRLKVLEETPYAATPKLTAREREVLAWAAAGKSAWETSCILGIAEKTVITHLENVRTKLNAANTTQAVVTALRLGELAPF